MFTSRLVERAMSPPTETSCGAHSFIVVVFNFEFRASIRCLGLCGSLAVPGWVCGETRITSNITTHPCSGPDSGAGGKGGREQLRALWR